MVEDETEGERDEGCRHKCAGKGHGANRLTHLAWQSVWMRLAMNSELPVAEP